MDSVTLSFACVCCLFFCKAVTIKNNAAACSYTVEFVVASIASNCSKRTYSKCGSILTGI